MIKGIGVDIVEIGRIAGLIERYTGHFLDKVFTPAEIAFCRGLADAPTRFAGRWAAKEAFYKALPVSCQAFSSWKSVEVLPSPEQGLPLLVVCNPDLRAQMDICTIKVSHISISHERHYCVAMVVME